MACTRTYFCKKRGKVRIMLHGGVFAYPLLPLKYVCVALVIQHAKRMPRIILSVVCSAVPYFSTLSHKRHSCRGKKLWDIKYVLISLKLLSETFIILRRNERDINVHVSSYKIPLNLVRF
jgi:hypothetical protein